jgi:precorrin-2 dehydrogenase/sirohydrochlorin ferrochelatase
MDAPHTPAMFALMLDVTTLPVMLIGAASLTGRLQALDDHGATDAHVFAPDPPDDLVMLAGARLTPRWPEAADFSRIKPRLTFISDMDDGRAAAFRALAKDAGALVHVQDRIPMCDFHLPAKVRRGHLQVTVSTDRIGWKAQGLSMADLAHEIEAMVVARGWLPPKNPE